VTGDASRIEVASDAQLATIVALLRAASLPTEDLQDVASRLTFWTVPEGADIVGAIALEAYGRVGLLRSLVVTPRQRGLGLGVKLVNTLEQAARARGIEQIVLLTQTAEVFFKKLGYHTVDRSEIPGDVRGNAQFHTLCPASATCMSKLLRIDPSDSH
jgi:amino-acid N-acetyltransferase